MLESLALNVAWFSSWNSRGIQNEVRAKQTYISTDLHESDAVRFVCQDLKIRCILFGSIPLCDGCRLQWKSCNKESFTVKPYVIEVCEVTLYFYNTCPLYRRISCVSGGWHAFLKFSAALKTGQCFYDTACTLINMARDSRQNNMRYLWHLLLTVTVSTDLQWLRLSACPHWI